MLDRKPEALALKYRLPRLEENELIALKIAVEKALRIMKTTGRSSMRLVCDGSRIFADYPFEVKEQELVYFYPAPDDE